MVNIFRRDNNSLEMTTKSQAPIRNFVVVCHAILDLIIGFVEDQDIFSMKDPALLSFYFILTEHVLIFL